MKILALELSSSRRSVAVLKGQQVLAEQFEAARQNVPPLLLIEQALNAANVDRSQIECITIGLGPGSYTGIRGAIALVQGWQLAANVKLLGISSVECIAAQIAAEDLVEHFAVVIDAQRGEFYLAEYDVWSKIPKTKSELRIVTLKDVENVVKSGKTLAGPEITRWFQDEKVIFPKASVLGQLASARQNFVTGDRLTPIYLRETTFVKAPAPRHLA